MNFLNILLSLVFVLATLGCASMNNEKPKYGAAEKHYIQEMKNRFHFTHNCPMNSIQSKVLAKKKINLGWGKMINAAKLVGLSGCQKKEIFRIFCELNKSYIVTFRNPRPGCLVLKEGGNHAAIFQNNSRIKTQQDQQIAENNRRQQQMNQRLNSYGTGSF